MNDAVERIRARRNHILAVGGEMSVERSAILELDDRLTSIEKQLAKQPVKGKKTKRGKKS